MVDVDELDLKAAEAEFIPRLFGEYLRVVQQVKFLELQLDYARGELRRVNRYIELPQDIRYGPDVVLVAVGYHHASDAVGVLPQVGDVRDDDIDAVELLVGKTEAAVNDDDVLPVFVHGEVLADLTETAERDDLQFCHIVLLISVLYVCTTVILHYNR